MLKKKAYNNLCLLYLDHKSNDKALEYATQSYSLIQDLYNKEPNYYQSDYSAALTSMGRVYDALNVPDSTEYYYREAQNLNNLLFKESGNANVESFWRKSLDLPFFYLKTNQYQKAIPELTTMINIGESFITKDSPLYQTLQSMVFLLGRSYRFCGNYNEAIINLEKFIRQNPDSFLGYLELARNDAYLGNKKDVIQNLKKAVKCNPDAFKGMEETDILFQYLNKI